MDSKTFMIPTMMPADGELIETELEQIAGVRQVLIDQPTHSITVTWANPATWATIERRLLVLNFTPDLPHDDF